MGSYFATNIKHVRYFGGSVEVLELDRVANFDISPRRAREPVADEVSIGT